MATELHNVMAAVLKVAKGFKPAPGPKPVLSSPAYIELVGWIAGRVEPKVPPAEQMEWRELVALSQKATLTTGDRQRLDRLMPIERQPSRAYARNVPSGATTTMAVAYGACLEKLQQDGKGARVAAVSAATLLGTGFVADLDRELARLDAVTIALEHGLTLPAPITETPWRGTSGVKTTHFVVRLKDEQYGLIAKTRGRWTFTAGPRDDILATLPESYMEEAVAALLGGAPRETPRAPITLVATQEARFTVRALARSGDVLIATGKNAGERAAFNLRAGAPADVPPEPWQAPPAPTLSPELERKLPKGKVTGVALSGDRVLVAYHNGKRVATFGPDGTKLADLDGRELGETVDELVPLECGLVFAFAPWPHGTMFFVEPSGRPVKTFRLGRFYHGGSSVVLDAGDRVAFAYHHRVVGQRLYFIATS